MPPRQVVHVVTDAPGAGASRLGTWREPYPQRATSAFPPKREETFVAAIEAHLRKHVPPLVTTPFPANAALTTACEAYGVQIASGT